MVPRFQEFRKQILIELAKVDEEKPGAYLDLKQVADSAKLEYKPGWVAKAAQYYNDNGLIRGAFSIGGGADGGRRAAISAEGLEQVEEWLLETSEDRVIAVDHNSAQFQETDEALAHLAEQIRVNNEYAAAEPEDREQRLAEIESGRRLLRAPRVRLDAVVSLLIKALKYLASKFADHAIGIIAAAALTGLLALLGIAS